MIEIVNSSENKAKEREKKEAARAQHLAELEKEHDALVAQEEAEEAAERKKKEEEEEKQALEAAQNSP